MWKYKTSHQFLGKLEAEIMEVLWERGSSSVRGVLNVLKKKREVAYTTVMTVMSRLYKKGLLKRKLDQSGAYIYTPKQDRQSFFASHSKKAIQGIIQEFGDVAVAQFIDIIEAKDFKNAKEWRKKLKKIS